ncbi:hypothetical protein D3C86_1752910 [compost metagenome]
MTEAVHVLALAPVRPQLLELGDLGVAVGEVIGRVVTVRREHEAVRGVRDLVDVDLVAHRSGLEGRGLSGHRGHVAREALGAAAAATRHKDTGGHAATGEHDHRGGEREHHGDLGMLVEHASGGVLSLRNVTSG